MTSQTSTLTKTAGASGMSRNAKNVVSAVRAFSSVSNNQKECWVNSGSSLRAQYPPAEPGIVLTIGTPYSRIMDRVSTSWPGLILTRPMTAYIRFPLDFGTAVYQIVGWHGPGNPILDLS